MFSSVLSLSLPLGLLSLGFFLFHSSTRSSESSMVSDEAIHSKASSAAPLVRSASMSSSGLQSSHHSSRHPSFFHREILKNSSVTCNDGTTAGYFIRSNPQSKRWLVFLEGGWHCYSQVSCHQRWIRARPLMTSAHWPQMRSMGGILSLDQEENPFWSHANHVLIPYCSSDSWSGSRVASNPGDFSFMGSQIIEQVMIDLLPHGLKDADFLLLAGSSAGAVGVLINLDRVSDLMHRLAPRVQVRGLADSGWFLDNEPYLDTNSNNINQEERNLSPEQLCQTSPHSCPPVESIKLGLSHWNGQVPSSCAKDYPGQEWKCYFGYRIYQSLRTPLFVVQWVFDEAQMTVDNVGSPVTRSQWNYIHRLGKELRKSLQNVTALFAPSCVSHTLLTKRSWTETKVTQTSLPDALRCWELETSFPSLESRMQQETPSSPNVLFATQSPLMIREDDNNSPALSGDKDSSETLIERNNKRRHVPSTFMSSSSLNHNHHNSHRQHHAVLMQQDQISLIMSNMESSSSSPDRVETYASKPLLTVDASSSTVSGNSEGNRIMNVHHVHHVIQGVSQQRQGQSREHTHIELIEEKRRPTSNRESKRKRKRKRKHHHRRRHNNSDHHSIMNPSFKDTSINHDRSSKNNLLFREIIDSISLVNGNNKLVHRDQPSLQSSPSTDTFNKQDNNDSSKHNSVTDLSNDKKLCTYKLMDHCSWPQCNRGCPRLYNPLTGKEMNFIDLFKTLGLDMREVAGALGMDTTTLSRMDHEALLQLLTH